MIDFLDMDSNKIVISEFYQNDLAGKYDYDTVYQRDKVWSEEKKSFLIDSILKNYPMPPVFFRMKIDSETGVTRYDVIDGKQRLTTIKEFIDGIIALPEDFGADEFGIDELNGAYFKDLEEYSDYKKQFWRYRIPVIFIDTEEDDTIRNVFDRLNRNGEPLVPQELRHAKYGGKSFYNLLEKLKEDNIWKDIFNSVLETDRKEDDEFISELLFLKLENRIVSYTKETLDQLYEKWSQQDIGNAEIEYREVEQYVKCFKLNYVEYRINKVSHLYAIWAMGILGLSQQIDSEILGSILHTFFDAYTKKEYDECMEEYKKSMSSDTKGSSSRKRRIKSLVDYCQKNNIQIHMDL